MGVPTTFEGTLILLVLAAVFWAGWVLTLPVPGGKWRWELYYLDFALGLLGASGVLAATFGVFLSEIGIIDNLQIIRTKQIGIVIGGAAAVNLGQMLFAASVSVGSVATSSVIAYGMAVAGAAFLQLIALPNTPTSVLAAAAVAIVAAVVGALARARMDGAKIAEERRRAIEAKRKPVKRSAWTGAILAAVGGLFLGGLLQTENVGRNGDIDMNPWALPLLFGVGSLLSALFLSIFFVNLPVSGAPVSYRAYFKGTLADHRAGWTGGAIWALGLAAYTVGCAGGEANGLPTWGRYAFAEVAFVLAAVTGLIFRHDTANQPAPAVRFWWISLVLLVASIAVATVVLWKA